VVELEETITLPASMTPIVLPDEARIEGDAASFRGEVTVIGTTLRFAATHRMEKRMYEAEDWPTFRTALLARKRFSESPLILSK
jgi:hypothetical protein